MPLVILFICIFALAAWGDASFLRQDCGLGIKPACDRIAAKYEGTKP